MNGTINKFNLNNILSNSKIGIFLEQGFISVLNFGSIFLFSKYLSISDFSQFILIYTIISFVFLLTTFFVTSPILIFIPKYWNDKKNIYLMYLLFINLFLSSIMVYFSFAIYGIFKDFFLTPSIFFFAVFWTSYEIFRKYVYGSQKKVSILVVTSLMLVFFVFLNVILNVFFSKLTINIVFEIYAISYTAIFLVAFFSIINFKDLKHEFNESRLNFNNIIYILRTHFQYSKWLIFGGIAFWFYSQGYFLLVERFLSNIELGKIRTIQNITGLFSIIIVVFENFYTPRVATIYLNEGKIGIINYVKNFYKKNIKLGSLLLVFIILWSYGFYYIFYFEKYNSDQFLIIIFAFSQFILLMVRPLVVSLKAAEITYPFSLAHASSAIFIITFGIILVYSLSGHGMAMGFLLSSVVFSIVIFNYYKKKIKI